ncbi:uncharacterized protein RCO7_01432 [Rhynchosporium graminicola]|uniref:Uncharacterized protein n=1 Tax=Rhynchosporium graminicola TaxID=2792576 RepID=A0A1E1JYZ6_9HELO|nr:uncharacterized protein RCO7_01432 [Rhynchosporium commune]
MDSVPTPSHRDEYAEDYSDVASIHSGNERRPRRKHVRGGRKGGYEEPTPEETAGLLGPEDGDDNEDTEEDGNDVCQYCSKKSKQPKPQRAKSQPRRRKIPEPFETGIRAFNVRRAAGGKRPVGVRTTSDKSKPRSSDAKTPSKKNSTSMSEDAGYETQSHESGSKAGKEDDESEEHEQEQADGGKPMSIRLDLDLMIEVFLKAKIKGAVTVTFL